MPRVVDPAARRQQIATAALEAIAERGLDAKLSDVGLAGGFTTGAVTHYFRSKDEVLVAALHEVNRRVGARMEARARCERPELRDLLAEALPLDRERRKESRVWISFYARAVQSPALARELRVRSGEWRGRARELLQIGQAEGRFRADLDIAGDSDALLALINGIGGEAVLDPRTWTAARQLAQLDRFLDSLRPPEDSP